MVELKIRIRGLSKRFGAKQVLDGVDLDVPTGTSLVVIGGSGSGKSVLLKCILGLIEPDDGVIEIDGRDIAAMSRDERELTRARIGMLFQNGALFDSLPVWENVAFGLLARGKARRAEAREKANDFLAQVGLAASVGDLSPAELSGGMQKRVALARAIAAQPDMMFFDEPTTGLDPIMGAVIDGLIVDCVKRLGSTAIAITHDMASRSADRRPGGHAEQGADHLDRSGVGADEQRQRGGRSVHPWPARGADPDGVAALIRRVAALIARLAALALVAAAPADDAPSQLVGLFVQGCMPFVGNAEALRGWAEQTGLPALPDKVAAAFLHGAPGVAFDGSNASGKFVLVSSDDGLCSAVTDKVTQPALRDALEAGLTTGRTDLSAGDRAGRQDRVGNP